MPLDEGQERAGVPADTMSALLAAVKEMKGWWGASSSTSSLMPPAHATESWLSRLKRESCARALAPWACGEAARRRGEHSGARTSGLGVWVVG